MLLVRIPPEGYKTVTRRSSHIRWRAGWNVSHIHFIYRTSHILQPLQNKTNILFQTCSSGNLVSVHRWFGYELFKTDLLGSRLEIGAFQLPCNFNFKHFVTVTAVLFWLCDGLGLHVCYFKRTLCIMKSPHGCEVSKWITLWHWIVLKYIPSGCPCSNHVTPKGKKREHGSYCRFVLLIFILYSLVHLALQNLW